VADNVAITAGAGTTIASDDIGSGVQAQRVKPVWGADGTGTDTQVAQPLPVQSTMDASQMSNLGTIVTPKFAVINVSSSGDNTIVATDSVHKIRVLTYVIVADGTVAVKWVNGTAGTAVSGAMSLVANTGVSAPFVPVGHFETGTTGNLVLNLSGAIGARGHCTYVLI
jgi:hypothetical protein